MRGLFIFVSIIFAAAFAGCSQTVVAPISQQPIGNIDDYFWKIGQAPVQFTDSISNYTLTFTDTNGRLFVNQEPSPNFNCIIDQDSIYASDYGLSRDSLFGPYSPYNEPFEFSTGLLLLRSNLFANDSSWYAGTLLSERTHTSYNLTARAQAHFDTLQIVSHGDSVITKYPDVLMVRYKYEGTSINSQDTIRYWIIYYAKNLGPVMIDKVTSFGVGMKQDSVIERHELAP